MARPLPGERPEQQNCGQEEQGGDDRFGGSTTAAPGTPALVWKGIATR
jgi:hypothetical protein